MSILMKNNNIMDKYNINVLPIYNNEKYNFNRLKYIPSFFIVYIDVQLIRGDKIIPGFRTKVGDATYIWMRLIYGCDIYTSNYGTVDMCISYTKGGETTVLWSHVTLHTIHAAGRHLQKRICITYCFNDIYHVTKHEQNFQL